MAFYEKYRSFFSCGISAAKRVRCEVSNEDLPPEHIHSTLPLLTGLSMIGMRCAAYLSYAIETGLRNRVAFSFSADVDRLIEYVVHNHLLRSHEEIYFGAEGGAADDCVWNIKFNGICSAPVRGSYSKGRDCFPLGHP